MIHSSREHLFNKLIVTRVKGRDLKETFLNISLDRDTLLDRSNEHVVLAMLSQEMLVTHYLRIDVPLSHHGAPLTTIILYDAKERTTREKLLLVKNFLERITSLSRASPLQQHLLVR